MGLFKNRQQQPAGLGSQRPYVVDDRAEPRPLGVLYAEVAKPPRWRPIRLSNQPVTRGTRLVRVGDNGEAHPGVYISDALEFGLKVREFGREYGHVCNSWRALPAPGDGELQPRRGGWPAGSYSGCPVAG
jgi:hypothetical protein